MTGRISASGIGTDRGRKPGMGDWKQADFSPETECLRWGTSLVERLRNQTEAFQAGECQERMGLRLEKGYRERMEQRPKKGCRERMELHPEKICPGSQKVYLITEERKVVSGLQTVKRQQVAEALLWAAADPI